MNYLNLSFFIICLVFSTYAFAITIEDINIKPREVAYICKKIDGEFPASIQAKIQFSLAGEDNDILYGNPKRKAYQSFELQDIKTTIYYYEFDTTNNMLSILDSIKRIVWGEKDRNYLHPEHIFNINNILVVVSSQKPSFYKKILEHRIQFPDINNLIIQDRIKALKEQNILPETNEHLRNFLQSDFDIKKVNDKELILIGRYWMVVPEENFKVKSGYENLYLKINENGSSLVSFGPIESENEDEEKLLLTTIEAQKRGLHCPQDDGLKNYIKTSYGKTETQGVLTGKSLAFIWSANRTYLRFHKNNLILITNSIFNTEKYIVAVFPFQL